MENDVQRNLNHDYQKVREGKYDALPHLLKDVFKFEYPFVKLVNGVVIEGVCDVGIVNVAFMGVVGDKEYIPEFDRFMNLNDVYLQC